MSQEELAFRLKDVESQVARLQADSLRQNADSTATITKISDRLQALETTRTVLIAVAVIFGVAGSWGWIALQTAQSKISGLQNQVTEVQNMTQKISDAEQKAITEARQQIDNEKNSQLSAFKSESSAAITQAKLQIDQYAQQSTGALAQVLPGLQKNISALNDETSFLMGATYRIYTASDGYKIPEKDFQQLHDLQGFLTRGDKDTDYFMLRMHDGSKSFLNDWNDVVRKYR